jgi:hypothetical protein
MWVIGWINVQNGMINLEINHVPIRETIWHWVDSNPRISSPCCHSTQTSFTCDEWPHLDSVRPNPCVKYITETSTITKGVIIHHETSERKGCNRSRDSTAVILDKAKRGDKSMTMLQRPWTKWCLASVTNEGATQRERRNNKETAMNVATYLR